MPQVVPPTPKIDWPNLTFGLRETNGYAKYTWKDGQWSKGEWVTDPYLSLHIANVAVNYGQSVFEGLKAFRHADGQVRVFRPQENALRMANSAVAVSMPPIPEDIFMEGVEMAVSRNLEFVPPYAANGSSGSMYIRPLLFGSGPQLALLPAPEVTFIVYVTPTGSLYGAAGKQAPAVDALVLSDFDRAAPLGMGAAKVAGNYAPTFGPMAAAKKEGYAITLHLDAKTRTHIDEFSTSNFLALKAPSAEGGKPTLVVPTSPSILKSVTTKSIVGIAKDLLGWDVELRAVRFDEVTSGAFAEVAACGTAAALTPVRSITYLDGNEAGGEMRKVKLGDGEKAGPYFLQMLSMLTGIQAGDVKQDFGWCWPAEGLDSAKFA